VRPRPHDGGLVAVLDGDDIGQRVSGPRHAADGRVREDVEAQMGVGFDPFRVQERSGRDAERGIERKVEEEAARPRGDLGRAPGKDRAVGVVPGVGPVEPVGEARNSAIPPCTSDRDS